MLLNLFASLLRIKNHTLFILEFGAHDQVSNGNFWEEKKIVKCSQKIRCNFQNSHSMLIKVYLKKTNFTLIFINILHSLCVLYFENFSVFSRKQKFSP